MTYSRPVTVRVLWLGLLSLASCRLLLGIEEPETLDRADAAALDGAVDARFDARVDGGVDARTDGACEPCGNECVFIGTDPRNCGACGNSCVVDAPSTVTCALGRCVAMLAEVPGALGRPVVSGGVVYFSNTNSNSVLSVPATGGNPSTIVAGDAGMVIAADVASVYWAANNRIFAASLDGGNPAPLTPSFGTVLGTSVDATGLTFATGATIRVLDIHGGDPQILATAPSTIRALTSDATNFYYTDALGNVSSVPRAGGTPTPLAFNQSLAADVAVSATDVYWSSSSATLMKVPIGGGSWSQVTSGIDRIAVDGAALYGRSSNGLVMLPVSGASSTLTVIGPRNATPDVFDSTSVYWMENGAGVGRIMKLTPK